MKEFFVVRGFKNTQVIMLSDAAELRRWGDTEEARRLIRRYRDEGYEAAKGMMPCLIVGERKAGHPLERRDENFVHADRILLDYDQPCHPEEVATRVAEVLRREGLLDYTYMERSMSGKLHLLAPRLTDDTAADIATYSRLLGLELDVKVTNPSRLMVLTFEALEGTRLENLMREREAPASPNPSQGEGLGSAMTVSSPSGGVLGQAKGFAIEGAIASYHGLAYEDIVAALIDELGGQPQVGDRNTFLYKAASELRTITDNNWAWVASLIGEHHYFGLPQDEALATIKSACRKSAEPRISPLMRRVLNTVALATFNEKLAQATGSQQPADDTATITEEAEISVHQSTDDNESNQKELSPFKGRSEASRGLAKCQAVPSEGSAVLCATEADRERRSEETERRGYTDASSSTSTFNPFAEEAPAMPPVAELPKFAQLLIKNVPRQCYAHLFNTLEPALATYLIETTATGVDGSCLHLGSGWLSAGIAKMSTGKSSRNEPLKAIMHKMKLQDDEARAQMDEWNELARCTKASDLPPRPKFVSHLLGSDCTSSALIMRLKHLDRGALTAWVDELGMLTSIQTNTTTGSNLPLLLAFAQEELTVDRSTEVGVSGSVTMRLNVSAQGTPYQAATFFRGGWHSGLISRFSISTIVEPDIMDDDDFLYGSYEGYQALIDPYIDLLSATEGQHLACRKADEHVRQLRSEMLRLAAEYSSEALRVLIRRQTIIAQKRAYLYWILAGRKWTARLEAFLTWRFRYSIWAIFYVLGDIIAHEQAEEDGIATRKAKQDGPTSWLMALPERFTEQQLTDLRKLKGAQADKKSMQRQLANWRSRHLIIDDPDTAGTYINLKKYGKG